MARLTVFRLNLDGTPDTSYGSQGEAQAELTTFQYNGAQIVAQRDGSAIESSQYYAGISSGIGYRLLSPSGVDVTSSPHTSNEPRFLVGTHRYFSGQMFVLASQFRYERPVGTEGDGTAEIQLAPANVIPLVELANGRISHPGGTTTSSHSMD